MTSIVENDVLCAAVAPVFGVLLACTYDACAAKNGAPADGAALAAAFHARGGVCARLLPLRHHERGKEYIADTLRNEFTAIIAATNGAAAADADVPPASSSSSSSSSSSQDSQHGKKRFRSLSQPDPIPMPTSLADAVAAANIGAETRAKLTVVYSYVSGTPLIAPSAAPMIAMLVRYKSAATPEQFGRVVDVLTQRESVREFAARVMVGQPVCAQKAVAAPALPPSSPRAREQLITGSAVELSARINAVLDAYTKTTRVQTSAAWLSRLATAVFLAECFTHRRSTFDATAMPRILGDYWLKDSWSESARVCVAFPLAYGVLTNGVVLSEHPPSRLLRRAYTTTVFEIIGPLFVWHWSRILATGLPSIVNSFDDMFTDVLRYVTACRPQRAWDGRTWTQCDICRKWRRDVASVYVSAESSASASSSSSSSSPRGVRETGKVFVCTDSAFQYTCDMPQEPAGTL